MNKYFYLTVGIPRGPFTGQQMINLAKNGKIKAKTRCIRNDEPSLPAIDFFGEKRWNEITEYIDAEKNAAIAEHEERKRLVKERQEQIWLEKERQRLALEKERAAAKRAKAAANDPSQPMPPEQQPVYQQMPNGNVQQIVNVQVGGGHYGNPDKNKWVAAILCFFLGCLGVHRFYMGCPVSGILYLLVTLTGIGAFLTLFVSFIEFLVIVCQSQQTFERACR